MKKYIVRFVILFGICLLGSLFYLIANGFNYLGNYINSFQIFGLFSMFFGVFSLLSNLGSLDLFGYSFYYLGASRQPGLERKYTSYPDYVEKKKANREGKKAYCLSYFACGLVLIIISLFLSIF